MVVFCGCQSNEESAELVVTAAISRDPMALNTRNNNGDTYGTEGRGRRGCLCACDWLFGQPAFQIDSCVVFVLASDLLLLLLLLLFRFLFLFFVHCESDWL